MHVLPMAERLQKQLVARNAGQDPQLYLRIIAAHQPVKAIPGHKDAADLFALLCTRRDVLQIGVCARKPACNRHRLLKMRVDAPCLRVDQGTQAVQIGALQLGQLAVLQNGCHQRMPALQRLQYLGIGRIACLGLFDNGQLQMLKQHHAQLLGRFQVKLLACLLLCQKLQIRNAVGHILAQLRQKPGIRRNPGKFHLRQHRCQRQLQLLVQRLLLHILQLLTQHICQKRDIFARIALYGGQAALCQILQRIRRTSGICNITCQGHIIHYSLHCHLAAQAAFINFLAVRRQLAAAAICQPGVKLLPAVACVI